MLCHQSIFVCLQAKRNHLALSIRLLNSDRRTNVKLVVHSNLWLLQSNQLYIYSVRLTSHLHRLSQSHHFHSSLHYPSNHWINKVILRSRFFVFLLVTIQLLCHPHLISSNSQKCWQSICRKLGALWREN